METFTPVNEEIEQLTCYKSAPESWWEDWPVVPLPESPSSRIRYDILEHMATILPAQSRNLIDMVISHLREGADIMCKGVGRSYTASQPANSAIVAGAAFTDTVVSWLKGKFVSGPHDLPPIPGLKLSAPMAVGKPDGSVRPVINFSSPANQSVNDGIDKKEVRSYWHTTMATAAQFSFILLQAGRGAKFSKADMVNAYKLILVRKEDWQLQGFQWMEKFFIELDLVMGARSSANLFDSLHELVIRIASTNTQFPRCLIAKCLDDVAAAAPASSNRLYDFFSSYISTCEAADIPLAEFNSENGKAFLNKTEGVVLGVQFNTVTLTWHFPPKKWSKLF